MTDMLVPLYNLPEAKPLLKDLADADIRLSRAMTLDREKILQFVHHNFHSVSPGWFDECDATLVRQPGTCFIAVHNKQVVGFACYDGSAKGFIGPVGVTEKYRRRGIARALLLQVCDAMSADGYGYAVIGWVSSQAYYAKALNAIPIPGSFPGIYHRLISPPES